MHKDLQSTNKPGTAPIIAVVTFNKLEGVVFDVMRMIWSKKITLLKKSFRELCGVVKVVVARQYFQYGKVGGGGGGITILIEIFFQKAEELHRRGLLVFSNFANFLALMVLFG